MQPVELCSKCVELHLLGVDGGVLRHVDRLLLRDYILQVGDCLAQSLHGLDQGVSRFSVSVDCNKVQRMHGGQRNL